MSSFSLSFQRGKRAGKVTRHLKVTSRALQSFFSIDDKIIGKGLQVIHVRVVIYFAVLHKGLSKREMFGDQTSPNIVW